MAATDTHPVEFQEGGAGRPRRAPARRHIAPDHQLVVVIGRNEFKSWEGVNIWAEKFMKILAEGMRGSQMN